VVFEKGLKLFDLVDFAKTVWNHNLFEKDCFYKEVEKTTSCFIVSIGCLTLSDF